MKTLALALLALLALGQAEPATDRQAPGKSFSDLPWAIRLGLRSAHLSQAIPLIDRVVLVPDAATYVDEISKWSLRGRWPVLLDDGRYAPLFVRRFKPAQLIRRAPGEAPALPQAAADRQRLLESVVVGVFGGDRHNQTIRDVFAKQKYVPPGVVISSANDPSWTAALALAAGRGQPLAWLDGDFGQPSDKLDHDHVRKLIEAVDSLVQRQGYAHQALGDDIDAITICRAMAVKADFKVPAAATPPIPPPHNEGAFSVTDLLGRNADWTRYAFTGWMFGDEARSASMAMCALFLPRERVLLYDTYPQTDAWAAYGMADAVEALQKGGFQTQIVQGEQANAPAWQRMLIGGLSTDLLLMNTKGNADFFDLSSGRALPEDVPVLNEPIALHLIHSWSMTSPAHDDTLGAQWLEHGAYAAVGSCHEPLLHGFVPPGGVANRITNLVPFLVAARWWQGEPGTHHPWRIVTIGDPLMLCPAPGQTPIKRVEQPADYGLDLNEHVKALMRGAAEDGGSADFAQAISILEMLGKDELAVQTWRLAWQSEAQRGEAAGAARAALRPLFRSRDVEGFMQAWEQVAARDQQALDMLWHLLLPRVGGGAAADRNHLLHLQAAIRQPAPHHDLERLAPLLRDVFGPAHARDVIEREINRAASPNVKQALHELLRRY